MAAGSMRDGDEDELLFAVLKRIRHEKLLGVHGIVQRQLGKLQIDPTKDAAAHSQAHGAHVKLGDRGSRQLRRRLHERRQELLHA